MENIIDLINKDKWTDAIDALKSLFEIITDGNNLFHFACMRGKIDVINHLLELNSVQIYNSNDDGNTGCHLLAINGWTDILIDISSRYPKFLKLRNKKNELTVHICIEKVSTLGKLVNLIDKNNYVKYLNIIEDNGYTLALDIIDKINIPDDEYDILFNKIATMGIDLNIPSDMPPTMFAIRTKKSFVACKILDKYSVNVNIKTPQFITPLIGAIKYNNVDVVKRLIEKGADVNYGGAENDNLPINMALSNGFWNICKLLLDSDKINYDQQDKYLNIPLHYAIDVYLRMSLPDEIIRKILIKSDVMKKNISGHTPLHMLAKFKLWSKFKNELNDKSIDINDADKNGNTFLSYSDESDTPNIVSYIEDRRKNLGSTQIITKQKESFINLPESIISDFGLFNSDIVHSVLYTVNLMTKYDDLIIPFQIYSDDKKNWELWKIKNEGSLSVDPIGDLFMRIIASHYEVLFTVVPYILFWRDKHLHYYNNNNDIFLKRAIASRNRFVLLKLTLFPHSSMLHANIIFYDKKTNVLRRFEPYGDWEFLDSYSLDEYISKLFIKCIPDDKKASLKYLRPGDYLHNTKFQLLSMDNDPDKKKLGDPAGYCLAWCFWFIELKLKNPDVSDKELVEDTLNDIIDKSDKSDNNPILTHIRNYAANLDKEKNALLEKMGIDKSDMYNLIYSVEKMEKIIKYITKYITKYCSKRLE